MLLAAKDAAPVDDVRVMKANHTSWPPEKFTLIGSVNILKPMILAVELVLLYVN